MTMKLPKLPPEPRAPEPRMRVKISDVAWGVFWGLTAWTVIAFFASIVLAGILAASTP